MTASALQATSYKAELSTAKPKTLTPGHLSLPTSALNDLYLILTSVYSASLALLQHKSLLAVPRYPRQAPTQGHCPCSGKLPLKVTANAAFSAGLQPPPPTPTARLACASCHFRETFPNHTLVKTATPAHQKSTYHTFPLLCLSFSIALPVKYDT